MCSLQIIRTHRLRTGAPHDSQLMSALRGSSTNAQIEMKLEHFTETRPCDVESEQLFAWVADGGCGAVGSELCGRSRRR